MTKFTTQKHEFNDDEAKSALQKMIRRGFDELAMYFALELAHNDKSAFGWLRNRLKIIAYEDVGLANPDCVLQVSKAVDDMDYLYENDNQEWETILSHIILLLCRSEKNRLNDHFKITMKYIWENERFDIPDYALDMHTTRGTKLGKGVDNFITEGQKLVNYTKLRDDEKYSGTFEGILRNKERHTIKPKIQQ